jgi:hypothetical protein
MREACYSIGASGEPPNVFGMQAATGACETDGTSAAGSTAGGAQLQPRHPLQGLLLDTPEGPSFAQRARLDYTPKPGSDRTLTVRVTGGRGHAALGSNLPFRGEGGKVWNREGFRMAAWYERSRRRTGIHPKRNLALPPWVSLADVDCKGASEYMVEAVCGCPGAEPSTSPRASSPSAPTSTSPAPSASGRSRRRPCGVTEGKPAGCRGAGG